MGGGILDKQLVALLGENKKLNMRYHHLNFAVRQWTRGGRSSGQSAPEELAN